MGVFSIAIDGPAGAGKSTVAKAVSAALRANYLDTGAMYRAMGLYMIRSGVELTDMRAVARACADADVRVRYEDGRQVTLLADEDVSEAIRAEACSRAASLVSQVPEVRSRMVAIQQAIARDQNLVMDGRDIGTKVLPNATVKIFLTASAEVRAQRRYEELLQKGAQAQLDKVREDIEARDRLDTMRAASPLVRAEDAVEVDTSGMTLNEVIAHVVRIARESI
ncbi:MAG: (d)CMP kinase [Christensenellales bacterium]